MSADNTSITLKEILLGIADSLNEAQNALRNAAPYDEYGRPNTLYTLPYLDFSLQVEAQVEKVTTNEENYNETTMTTGMEMDKYGKGGYPTMSYRPISKSSTSKEENKISSTISGRFVAIMPNEGLPQLIIETKTEKKGTLGRYAIEVSLINSAGEKIPNGLIEFNYNEIKTSKLNPNKSLNHNTNFLQAGELYSNIEGKATNEIQIDPSDYTSGAIIQIDINVGPVQTKLSIQKD